MQTITNAAYTGENYSNSRFPTTIGYLHFAIVVNALYGNTTILKIVEWRIAGKQLTINYLFNCDYTNMKNKPDISLYSPDLKQVMYFKLLMLFQII